MRGHARLIEDEQERAAAIVLLRAKYPQYSAGWLAGDSPVIRIEPEKVVSWGALGEAEKST